MGALSYAAVPLYRMFCQVTGYAGTTQKAERASDVVLDRMVTVRFDANVTPGMAWEFEPEQRTMRVKVGENVLAFYKASNKSDKALTGEASFNVSPEIAGSYFAKIECFCFKEQTLAAGESVEMPVSFFIDPSIANDRDANLVREITLSYTFYPVTKPTGAVAAEAAGKPGKGS
jgi:cytochrome c oxidase assembly protein subunit 11